MNKLLGRSVPVTLLYEWINKQEREKTGEDIKDSTAALFYVKGYDDPILAEKAAAGVAIARNKSSIWDCHGFTNVMLILNSVPASADYIAAVDPAFMNYAAWELTEWDPGILIGPEAERSVMASLHTFDYPYPPSELAFVEEFLLRDHGVAAEEAGKVYRRAAELIGSEPDLDKVIEKACSDTEVENSSFIMFHVVRLLSVDHYTGRMISEYNRWKTILEV